MVTTITYKFKRILTMKKSLLLVLSCLTLSGFALLNGCGGGGGGSTSSPVAVKFRTYSASVPAGISDVGFRVSLPTGVTIANVPDPSNPNQTLTAPGALRLSGIFASTFINISSKSYPRPLFGKYSAAKPAGSGKDIIWVSINMTGNPRPAFSIGEFLTINGIAAPGVTVTKGSFTVDQVILGGDNGGFGVPMTGKIDHSL